MTLLTEFEKADSASLVCYFDTVLDLTYAPGILHSFFNFKLRPQPAHSAVQ